VAGVLGLLRTAEKDQGCNLRATRGCKSRHFIDMKHYYIVEVAIDFAADLPVRVIGDAGASGFCDPFKPRGNAYAVAENSIVINDDVEDVNADPEFSPDIRRNETC
jgi:hypothetical protein